MKNLKKLLLLLLLTGVTPIIAKANNIQYEAVVTNEKGLKYCDDIDFKNCKTLEVGTKFLTSKYSDKIYSMEIDGKDFFTKNISDFKPVDKEANHDYEGVLDWDSEAGSVIVGNNAITKEDVVLKKGPDATFDAITIIPKGTEIKFRYYDLSDEEDGYPVELFVSYDGKEGWVNTSNEKVMIYNSELSLFVNIDDVKTSNYTIPKYTYLPCVGFTDKHDYIKYEEYEIPIKQLNDKIWKLVYPFMIKSNKEIKLYGDFNKTKVIETIKPGQVMTLITGDNIANKMLHLVDVDGTKGLIEFGESIDNTLFDYIDEDVNYEAIGLGEYIEDIDNTTWTVDNNSNKEEKKEESKKENKEEEKVDVKKTAITIIAVTSIIILAGLVFVFKK